MQLLVFHKGSRSKVLAAFLLGMMIIFVGRLFYLQIIKHGEYVKQSAAEQIKPLIIPAKRGLIYALDGSTPVPLVINQTVYTMFADPATVTNPMKVLEVIHKVAGGNLQPNPEKLLKIEDSRYQILGKKLTRKQAETIKKENLNGIGFQEESVRVYPESSLAAQTLGFVNSEGQGQYGVEEALNDQLTGRDGLLKSVTDVSGVPLTIGNQNINKPAQDGKNIVLTIDRNVQAYTEKALAVGMKKSGAKKGSVIVMDPQTGKIMAMANLPTYNPANYGKVQDASAFNNATVSVPYEPGSDVKTLTMAAGIDQGVVSANATYNNTDFVKVKNISITNATRGQTGNITFQHALNYSLNTGFVTVADRLGSTKDPVGTADINYKSRQTLYDYFHNRLRLGELTGIQLAGEARGIVVPPGQSDTSDGGSVRYSNMAFGQGLDVTMVQMTAAFSAIINGGTYNTPLLIDGSVNRSDNSFHAEALKKSYSGVVSASTSSQIRKMVHDARGAFYAYSDKPGYFIGGKTGTSQAIVNGTYSDTQTIGTYLGYGGDSSASKGPKYVIMVQVSGKNQNLQGGEDAMPIFTDISNWLIDYLKLQPKG